MDKKYTIAVVGTGYVGLSIATLLSQYHKVYDVDIVPAKVDMVNQHKSPIQDEYIQKYLAEKDLDLTAMLDAEMAYSAADFVVIAAPTNVHSKNRRNAEIRGIMIAVSKGYDNKEKHLGGVENMPENFMRS